MEFSENIIPASNVDMYQVHGDHIDSVMDTQAFQRHFQEMISQSVLRERVSTEVMLRNDGLYETDILSLHYGKDDFGFSSIILVHPERKNLLVVASYPVYLHKKMMVRLEKVWVWDNLLEATIECSIRGEFTFSFIATDYFAHKDDYLPGKEIEIRVGAMGMQVREPKVKEIALDGQPALAIMSHLGQNVEYDENGQVKPLKISTEQLVYFNPSDEKCPDEASFQAPAGDIRERRFLGIDFYETDILICRRSFDVSIPLIFKKEMYPDARKDMPLSGVLWIAGSF